MNESGIKVRFLGTGAATWKPGAARRYSSVLLDDSVLIDFTPCAFEMIPDGVKPKVLFITHSHGDHYNPEAAVKVGVKRVYVQKSWAKAAKRHIAATAERLHFPAPRVISLPFGKVVKECGLFFTGIPANHSTSRVTDGELERASLYLVEKGTTRLLYATDTGGIMGDAARMIGIDPHVNDGNYASFSAKGPNPFIHRPQAITALIMEATDGLEDEDYRIFVHSSVQLVSRTVNSMLKHGRYCPPEGQSVYITHLAIRYGDWPHEKIDAELPVPLKSAYDGLEVIMG